MAKNRDLSKFPNAITVLDNGNVGIGATGNEKFVVYNTINDYSSVKFTNSCTTGQSYGPLIQAGTNSTDASLRVQSQSGTSYFHIRGDGNIGIGTASPVSLLHLQSGNLTIAKTAIGSGTEVGNITFRNDYMGAYDWAQIKGVNGSSHDFSNIVFSTTYGFNSMSEKMRLTSDGKLGIGTSSPGSKLHLYDGANPISLKIQRTSVPVYLSDVQPAGTTAAAAWTHNMENTSNGSVSWGGFANGSYAGSAIMLNANTGSSYITFHTAPSANTNPSERFRIDGRNGYTNTYQFIGNISSTSLNYFSDAQTQRWYFNSPCDNTWRALVANINQRHFFVRIWGSDAGTNNYGEHYFTMSFPGYGVSNNANLHYVSGGWNTGAYEISYTNNGGAYYLIFRNTSYYSSSNVATYYMEIVSS